MEKNDLQKLLDLLLLHTYIANSIVYTTQNGHFLQFSYIIRIFTRHVGFQLLPHICHNALVSLCVTTTTLYHLLLHTEKIVGQFIVCSILRIRRRGDRRREVS